MSHYGLEESRREETADHDLADDLDDHASSEPVPISSVDEDESPDLEQHAGSDGVFQEGRTSSAPANSWGSFASLGLSILNGEAIWHQPRRDDRSR